MKDDPKWKKFEKLVGEIQTQLSPLANVVVNDKVLGKNSKRKRQIDVSVYSHVG